MDESTPRKSRLWLTVWLASAVLLLLAVNGALLKISPVRTPPRVDVQTLKDLSELITVEYRVKKLVSARDIRWYGDRKILIETAAILKAGIDLNRFDAQSIRQQGDAVTITLPRRADAVQHAAARHARSTTNPDCCAAIFAFEEKDDILRQGEADIRARVSDMGILRRAEANARVLLESWVRRSGFRDVGRVFTAEKKPGGGR